MPSLVASLSLIVVFVAPVPTRNSIVAYICRDLDSNVAATYAASRAPGLKRQGFAKQLPSCSENEI
jgi:hypothetical protein